MVEVGLRIGRGRVGRAGQSPRSSRQATMRREAANGSFVLRSLLIGGDAAALFVAWSVTAGLSRPQPGPPAQVIGLALASTMVGCALFHALGLYRSQLCTLRSVEYARIARGCVLLGLLVLTISHVVDDPASARQLAIGVPLAFVGTVIARDVYRSWLAGRRRGGAFLRSIVVVGSGDEAEEMVALLDAHPDLGYRIVGVVGSDDTRPAHLSAAHRSARFDDLLSVIRETDATGAIICVSDLHHEQLNDIVQRLLAANVRVQLSSGLHGVDVRRLLPSPLAHEPMFSVEPMRLAVWQLGVKRAIDVVLATAALLVTVPVIALAAIGIKLQDRGRVFFRQVRVGRDGETFLLYKLRTMCEGAEFQTTGLLGSNVRDGPLVKVQDDPRVTKLGRMLRATSIDELPQLWNVLNGTMSLVGPRPALPSEVAHFDAELRTRDAVRPGVTGLWQVEGRDNPSFSAYRRLDLFYLRNWTIGLDLMILVGTVGAVAARLFRGVANLDQGVTVGPEVGDPAPAFHPSSITARPVSFDPRLGARAS